MPRFAVTAALLVLTVVVAGPSPRLVAQSPAAIEPGDDFASPRVRRYREAREDAIQLKLDGRVPLGQKVVQAADGRFVEHALERVERVFVVLAEHTNLRHNGIPEPDRLADATSIWVPDFNKAYYEDLIFRRVRQYYEGQSGGRYSISGDVTEWTTVDVLPGMGFPVHAVNAWVQAQLDGGRSLDDVTAYLRTFDRTDPYDVDGDGVFEEPDGSLDQVIVVDAGGSGAFAVSRIAADGDPASPDPEAHAIGATGLSITTYAYAAENAAVGVFAHEFGHLLGLPDEYMEAAYGSPSGHWTIMSYHFAFGAALGLDGLIPLNAWDKLQLGWLNYTVVAPATRAAVTLGAAGLQTREPQALVVNLPPATNPLRSTTSPIPPPEGSAFWWARQRLGTTSTMTTTVDVPSDAPALQMLLWYDTAGQSDFGYVSVSTDGGQSWTNLSAPGVTTDENVYGDNEGNGITGDVGDPILVTFDMATYAGQRVQLRVRYTTAPPSVYDDGGEWAAQFQGFVVDDIVLGSFRDGAETADSAWALDGFERQVSTHLPHYYIAEYRNHAGADAPLAGMLALRGPSAARFGYDPGLVVWYRNRAQHVHLRANAFGYGGLSPIDAHPAVDRDGGGAIIENRLQTRDAAFSLVPTMPLAYSSETPGGDVVFPSLAPEPVFDDSRDYWSSETPRVGIRVPRTGTMLRVVSTNMKDAFMQIVTGRW